MILLAFIVVLLMVVWRTYHAFAYRRRRLVGKNALVTGACSELGRRLCQALHSQGVGITAWDYSRTQLDELRVNVVGMAAGRDDSAIGSASPTCSTPFAVHVVDLSSRQQITRAVKELPRVDLIFNVSHCHPITSLVHRGDDAFERVIQTNMMAPLLLARHLCPAMLERHGGGGFVTFTSCGASPIDALAPDYSASQWGLTGLHLSIRAWLRHEQKARRSPGEVRTTLVCVTAVRQQRLPPAKDGKDEAAGPCAEARAMEKVVVACLRAVERGDEWYSDSWRAALAPLAFVLPIPWSTSVMRWMGMERLADEVSTKDA